MYEKTDAEAALQIQTGSQGSLFPFVPPCLSETRGGSSAGAPHWQTRPWPSDTAGLGQTSCSLPLPVFSLPYLALLPLPLLETLFFLRLE